MFQRSLRSRALVAIALLCAATTAPAEADVLGKLKSLAAPAPPAIAGQVIVGFTPAGRHPNVETVILRAIRDADDSLKVAIFTFTSKPIAEALVAAHKRGVRVGVIVDSEQNTGQYSAGTFVANQGVPTRVAKRYNHMHHKFAVVDGEGVLTGSANWTASARDRNAENVIYLPKSPDVAIGFRDEWDRLWRESQDLGRRH